MCENRCLNLCWALCVFTILRVCDAGREQCKMQLVLGSDLDQQVSQTTAVPQIAKELSNTPQPEKSSSTSLTLPAGKTTKDGTSLRSSPKIVVARPHGGKLDGTGSTEAPTTTTRPVNLKGIDSAEVPTTTTNPVVQDQSRRAKFDELQGPRWGNAGTAKRSKERKNSTEFEELVGQEHLGGQAAASYALSTAFSQVLQDMSEIMISFKRRNYTSGDGSWFSKLILWLVVCTVCSIGIVKLMQTKWYKSKRDQLLADHPELKVYYKKGLAISTRLLVRLRFYKYDKFDCYFSPHELIYRESAKTVLEFQVGDRAERSSSGSRGKSKTEDYEDEPATLFENVVICKTFLPGTESATIKLLDAKRADCVAECVVTVDEIRKDETGGRHVLFMTCKNRGEDIFKENPTLVISWKISTDVQDEVEIDEANLLQGIKLNTLHKSLKVQLETSAKKRAAQLCPEKALTSTERSQEQLELLAGILQGDLCEVSDLGHETHLRCAIYNEPDDQGQRSFGGWKWGWFDEHDDELNAPLGSIAVLTTVKVYPSKQKSNDFVISYVTKGKSGKDVEKLVQYHCTEKPRDLWVDGLNTFIKILRSVRQEEDRESKSKSKSTRGLQKSKSSSSQKREESSERRSEKSRKSEKPREEGTSSQFSRTVTIVDAEPASEDSESQADLDSPRSLDKRKDRRTRLRQGQGYQTQHAQFGHAASVQVQKRAKSTRLPQKSASAIVSSSDSNG